MRLLHCDEPAAARALLHRARPHRLPLRARQRGGAARAAGRTCCTSRSGRGGWGSTPPRRPGHASAWRTRRGRSRGCTIQRWAAERPETLDMEQKKPAGLVLGLVIGLIAGVVVSGLWTNRKVREGWDLVPVIVATQDLEEGTVITFEYLNQRSIPEQFVTSNAVRPDAATYIINQKLRVAVVAGEPMHWSYFETSPSKPAPGDSRPPRTRHAERAPTARGAAPDLEKKHGCTDEGAGHERGRAGRRQGLCG